MADEARIVIAYTELGATQERCRSRSMSAQHASFVRNVLFENEVDMADDDWAWAHVKRITKATSIDTNREATEKLQIASDTSKNNSRIGS